MKVKSAYTTPLSTFVILNELIEKSGRERKGDMIENKTILMKDKAITIEMRITVNVRWFLT
ncbi:MAG: hypothetical protein ACXACU_01560 [Candidatus Hodarchaeales archaeon]